MNSSEERETKRKYLTSLIEKCGLKSTINVFQNILDAIWTNVFTSPKFDSYLNPRIRNCPGIISSIHTLDGVNELCEIGDFSDVYLLIRKIKENLFLDLFLFEAQKTFEKLPNDYFNNIDFSNPDELIKELIKYNSLCIDAEMSKDELKAINKWKDNKLLMANNDIDKKNYFEFKKYLEYLKKNNNDFNECYDIFLKERFSKMGLKLNDYVHNNGESLMINRKEPIKVLSDIKETLISLEHLFLISLFLVDSTLFSSEDYEDYVECNMTPPEGSQYWVNGYILEAFLNIKSTDKELFQYLINHNNYSMRIDIE